MRSVWYVTGKETLARLAQVPAGMRIVEISSAVSDDGQPVFFSARPTVKPGVPLSMMNIDMSCRAEGPVLAATSTLACTPLVMGCGAVEDPFIAI
jgi:hypothetical protein